MVNLDRIANFNAGKGRLLEVKVKRQDAMRGRLRTVAPDGEDLIINLPRGKVINEDDVFGPSATGSYYKMLIEPELVVKVTLKNPENPNRLENAIKLGYNLGNRHLEVLIEDGVVYVPVTIGEEKVKKILDTMNLPIRYESIQKVISTTAAGYHAGEEEEV
jgi:urease accessory protein UreE